MPKVNLLRRRQDWFLIQHIIPTTMFSMHFLPGSMTFPCPLVMRSSLLSRCWMGILKPHRASVSPIFRFIDRSSPCRVNRSWGNCWRTITTSPVSTPGWNIMKFRIICLPNQWNLTSSSLEFKLLSISTEGKKTQKRTIWYTWVHHTQPHVCESVCVYLFVVHVWVPATSP